MKKDELPELTLDDIMPKFLELLNEGKYEEAIGMWLYVKLGQDDFIEKTDNAIMEAARQALERSKDEKKETEQEVR